MAFFNFAICLMGKSQFNSAFRLLPFLFLFIWLHLCFKTNIGGFLSDAGWYGDAEKVFLSCLQLCTLHSEVLHCFRAVECCVRSVCDYLLCLTFSAEPLLELCDTSWSIWLFLTALVLLAEWACADDAPCRCLPQAASRPKWQLQVPPGRGDLQTCPVIHGQASQTRPRS